MAFCEKVRYESPNQAAPIARRCKFTVNSLASRKKIKFFIEKLVKIVENSMEELICANFHQLGLYSY